MPQRKKIGEAPSGENTSLAGTEKVPVSGSQYTLVSTIASYIRTLTQTLTNKTINLGSNTLTGTTAQFNTALSDGDFATLAGSEALTNKTLTSPTLTTPTFSGAAVFPDNVRQTFNPGADAAGLNVGSHAGDPGTPANGDLWYDSTNNTLDARINGATVNLGAGGGNAFGTLAVSGQSDVVADAASDTLTLVAGSNVTITTNAGADSVTIAMSGVGGVTGPGSATDNAIARFDGTGGGTIQNSAVTVDDTGAFAFPDNVRQTFNPGADAAGINVGSIAGDPGTPSNGDLWYDSTANELTARINGASVALGAGSAPAYINIQDQKAQNTQGGGFTSGAWRTRDLNTEVSDDGGHASVASNQITLAAGTYVVQASAPGFRVAGHQIRLQDITNTATLAIGTAELNASGSAAAGTRSYLSGKFTLAGSTVIELQHQCATTKTTDGYGVACNFTTEVYSIVEFWKVA